MISDVSVMIQTERRCALQSVRPVIFMKKILSLFRQISMMNILFLIVSGVVNAIGVTVFLFPVKLYDSGISGLSMLLDQLTPETFSLSLFLVILNIPIFLYGSRKQGVSFTVYSLIAVSVYSFVSWLIRDVLPVDVSFASPLAGEDLLLCALFGGVISGIGSGLAIRFGGAMDGIDVLAVMIGSRTGISVGTFVMGFNTVLYIACGLFLNSWILPLYSIVTYAAGSKTVDFIVEGFDRQKCAMIITDKSDVLLPVLAESFPSTGTVTDARGGYTSDEKQIIWLILNRFQIAKLRDTVHEADPHAIISITEVTDMIKKE